METQKLIDAIDSIKDAHGEARLALQLLRWYLTQTESPAIGGAEGDWWLTLLQFAQKQALVGVMFEGIQLLPKELTPQGPALLAWIAQAQLIERQSRKLNAATAAVYRCIREAGAEGCILKGQGNALLYQNPLARTPGDVDVWIAGRRGEAGTKGRAVLRAIAEQMTRQGFSYVEEHYQHIVLTMGRIPVELHPTPAMLYHPLHNRRLQQWLSKNAPKQCSNLVELPEGNGQIATPTTEFNLVYQLLHLYHHHLFEGIGLRQFADYALLIRNEELGMRNEEFSNLKTLNLTGFAGAVMYVLREVFGIPNEQLLVPADEKRGRLLLADILHGGNFGHYGQAAGKQNALTHNLRRLCRDLRLMRYYPAETTAEPFFRLWHFLWRKRQSPPQ